ncbi:MAG: type II toxin-antitoxin system HipA family toxin YjjJ [Betaproteobacteria bacterium]|nr:type II toxin-antitoxin system HipA family toxin YjjJ [Betaproteobacteria bacterium]
MTDVADLVAELRHAPLSNAAALIRALGLGSQATLSRLVTRAGDAVVPVGRARARRYAAARDVRGLGTALPLYRVGADGALSEIGTLRPIVPDGYALERPANVAHWMRGHRGDGVSEGLPVFLADARPQGFLGRTFARRHAAFGLPDNPEAWSDDDTIVALARGGEDGIGDLVVGRESARRLYASRSQGAQPIAPEHRTAAYPALADEAIDGVLPGSSAGGEQPKFGALVGPAQDPHHVLVKFSPRDDSAAAVRWRDLLRCEQWTLHALGSAGFPVPASDLVEGGSRLFLETSRFDRVGAYGRLPVVTLSAMNNEYAGMLPAAGHWLEAAESLAQQRWMLPATVAQVRCLQWFGRFIANTDMHFGNLSFFPQDDGTLALAPVYDMLPMRYAPIGSELPARAYAPPVPEPGQEAAWFAAAEIAAGYWDTVAADARISGGFRAIAAGNASALRDHVGRFAGRPP